MLFCLCSHEREWPTRFPLKFSLYLQVSARITMSLVNEKDIMNVCMYVYSDVYKRLNFVATRIRAGRYTPRNSDRGFQLGRLP